MTIWLMRIAWWIPTATNTQSEYVILSALPGKIWLDECASLLHIAGLVFPWWHTKIRIENWNIQGVFQIMLIQTWGMSSAHLEEIADVSMLNSFLKIETIFCHLSATCFWLWRAFVHVSHQLQTEVCWCTVPHISTNKMCIHNAKINNNIKYYNIRMWKLLCLMMLKYLCLCLLKLDLVNIN